MMRRDQELGLGLGIIADECSARTEWSGRRGKSGPANGIARRRGNGQGGKTDRKEQRDGRDVFRRAHQSTFPTGNTSCSLASSALCFHFWILSWWMPPSDRSFSLL